MSDYSEAIERVLTQAVQKLVLSNPTQKQERFRKITIRRFSGGWQAEKRTEQQVFHENLDFAGVLAMAQRLFGASYLQCNLWDNAWEHSLRVTSKGRILAGKRACRSAESPQEHNRKKNYLLPEGVEIAPLVDMGVFTKEGKVVAAMQDKFRQINRFAELIDDTVSRLPQTKFTVVDFGCGKSYLTFVLYYYFRFIAKKEVRMIGIDRKAEVVDFCRRTAAVYGYDGMEFFMGDVADFSCVEPVDIVVSLHACDTATDYALHFAVEKGAKLIFSAPCCQHELNGQMQSEALPILTRYGIVKERAAALFTDAIRANLLESCGYKTQLLEFVELSHTPKNLLIRAVRTNSSAAHRASMRQEALDLCETLQFDPCLLRLLDKGNTGD